MENLNLFDEHQRQPERPSHTKESSVGANLDHLACVDLPYARRNGIDQKALPCVGQAERRKIPSAREDAIVSLAAVDRARMEANRRLDPTRKAQLGQFMTPIPIAHFMASLFSEPKGTVRLLDAGAGVGSLTAAFITRWGTRNMCLSAYEIDSMMAGYLRETVENYGKGIEAKIIERDFIQDAVYGLKLGNKERFTHAIQNPPYKKINSDSQHRALLRLVGLETVNLYTAFLGLAIEMMEEGGEIVSIIPRSFCNGLYYKPFRTWLLEKSSIEHIHLFHSRTSAFNDDEVLQESVIIKLVRGKTQGRVTITTSSDSSFSDLQANEYAFPEIVHVDDEQKFIHVPTAPTHSGIGGVPLASKSLHQIGIEVSTGPVVDFRLKQFLRDRPQDGAVPLLYPTHFANGSLEWPRQSKKANAIINNAETKKWLYPNGSYTVVRRFSSKEEPRRIVAHVVDPNSFNADVIGFENHLNVFHSQKHGISKDVAHGLSVFLNSTAVDEYFRRFSGHTQVNATDLRLLRYPEIKELKQLGEWIQKQRSPSQEQIDQQVAELDGRKQDR